MSGRTAKLIRKWANTTGQDYRRQKHDYARSPRDVKTLCRRNMRENLAP